MMYVLEPKELVRECYLRQAFEYLWSNYLPTESPLVDELAVPYFPRWFDDAYEPPLLEHTLSLLDPSDMPCWQQTEAELYLLLSKGKLPARGRRIHDAQLEAINSVKNIPFEDIPSDFWSLGDIDWLASGAARGTDRFIHVRVNFWMLLETSPLEGLEPCSNVSRWHNHLLATEPSIQAKRQVDTTAEPSRQEKRGRPPMGDWQALKSEALLRILSGEAPKKLDAFKQDLIDWCQKNGWEKTPSLSSIQNHVAWMHSVYRQKDSENTGG